MKIVIMEKERFKFNIKWNFSRQYYCSVEKKLFFYTLKLFSFHDDPGSLEVISSQIFLSLWFSVV